MVLYFGCVLKFVIGRRSVCSIREQMVYQSECAEVGMSTGVLSTVCLCTYQTILCIIGLL